MQHILLMVALFVLFVIVMKVPPQKIKTVDRLLIPALVVLLLMSIVWVVLATRPPR
jgi:hypothetical protein